MRFNLMAPEDGDGGTAVAAPAAAPAAAPVAAPAPAAAAPAPVAAPAAPAADTAGKWPTNWREDYSKEDAKKLEKLQRYASPEAALDAMFAAQQRISSGELKPVLKKDATPEQKAEWRKAHDVPETPGKYELKGVAIDDAEKPMFEELFKSGHESDMSNGQMASIAKTWGTIREKAFEAQAQKDRELAVTGEDALRAEWGTEYTRNKNLINGMMDSLAPGKLKDQFMTGRLADGTPVGSSPAALKMLLGLALVANPTGVIVPGGGANSAEVIDDEIKAIEKTMGTKAYINDEAKQERYRALIDARSKMKGR